MVRGKSLRDGVQSAQRLLKIAHSFCPVVNGSLSNSVEAHCRMEGIGSRVWWLDIHFTYHSLVPCLRRQVKEVLLEKPRNPHPARGLRDNDAIDVDTRFVKREKPRKIRILVGGVVIERNQEGSCSPIQSPRIKGHAQQRGKAAFIKSGGLLCMRIVQ